VLDREALEACRAQWATATFAHLLGVVKDVDHCADVFHGTKRSVAVTVRIDQAKDVVAIATGVAWGSGGRITDRGGLRGVVVGPHHLAGKTACDRAGDVAASVTEAARLQWRDERNRSGEHNRNYNK
jgi:hypothetical protein